MGIGHAQQQQSSGRHPGALAEVGDRPFKPGVAEQPWSQPEHRHQVPGQACQGEHQQRQPGLAQQFQVQGGHRCSDQQIHGHRADALLERCLRKARVPLPLQQLLHHQATHHRQGKQGHCVQQPAGVSAADDRAGLDQAVFEQDPQPHGAPDQGHVQGEGVDGGREGFRRGAGRCLGQNVRATSAIGCLGAEQPATSPADHHQRAADQHRRQNPHRRHRQTQGLAAGQAEVPEGGAHAGGGPVTALEAHLDQAGHQRVHPQPGAQHQQHRQAADQVLAEAQHHAEGGLAGRPLPEHRAAGQGLTKKQGGEDHVDQHPRGLGPDGVHRFGEDPRHAERADQHAQQAGDQCFRQAKATQPAQPLAQPGGEQQQQAEGHEGDQHVEDLHRWDGARTRASVIHSAVRARQISLQIGRPQAATARGAATVTTPPASTG